MANLQSYYRQLQKDDMITSRCEEIIKLFLDQQMTIRLCAENMCMSKSNVHKYIHTQIKDRYPTEYDQIRRKLQWNSKNLCINRKYWK